MTEANTTSVSECNQTEFWTWYDTLFTNERIRQRLGYQIQKLTRADKHLWELLNLENLNTVDENNDEYYFNLQNLDLSNGQAMDLLGDSCQKLLRRLKWESAGDHGPLSDQSIYEAMCNEFCLYNDQLRDEAMLHSNCSCLELSTKQNELSYHVQGDWCRENSGMILCNELKRCGIHNCTLDDFHCYRREYNKNYIIGKGYGGECGIGCRSSVHTLVWIVLFVIHLFHLF